MKTYLQYLVVLLDDTSIAYCHADNPLTEPRLMPLPVLQKAIRFGMQQNLMIQFVYPDYDLPEEYNALIETIDHVKIGRDIKVRRLGDTTAGCKTAVLRLTVQELTDRPYDIAALISAVERLNICLTDIETFRDEQIPDYGKALDTLVNMLVIQYKQGKQPQVNILTDRLQLTGMHNCEAGIGNITVAPNGKFYLCPAFYYDEQMGISNRMNHKTGDVSRSVGDLEQGVLIPNKQLLLLDHAPLCRICDAYHCHRCIWLNQRLTWDNNTPSRQQCVIAHIERNAAQRLQQELQKAGYTFEQQIKPIDYLDPFEVREKV